MLDLHCHILYDVDDGSRDFVMSKDMLAAAKAVGIDAIVATPHCRWDSFDRDKIEEHFEMVAAYAEKIGIRMFLGYEVNWRKIPEFGIDEICSMHIENTDLFLLEFSDDALPANWQRIVESIQARGLKVIIAHPERYAPVQRNLAVAEEMKELGCRLQLSANFIDAGRFNPRLKTATELLKAGYVDYVASDAHRPGDYEAYPRALEYARKMAR